MRQSLRQNFPQSRAEPNRLEKLYNDFSGECFFVYYASGKQFHDLLQCFDKPIQCLVACKNSGSFMKLKGFSSGSDASMNNYFVLRFSFCLPES